MTASITPDPQATALDDKPSVIDFVVKYGLLIIFAALLVIFWIAAPNFGSGNTLISIVQAQAAAGIAALGMTLTAIIGDLDLSVGSIAGLSVTVAAMTMIQFNLTGGTAIAFCLLAGLIVGGINALLIVTLKIPPLLVTLGTMFTVAGLSRWLVKGQTLSSGMTLPDGSQVKGRFTENFNAIDGSKLLGLPISVWIFIVISLLVWIFLEKTRFGRVHYAVGGNAEAARLAGARINRYRTGAYIASGVLASIAGIIIASRIRQGDITAGSSLLLDAVAITLIGFAVLGAKRPNALGTIVGALFLGTVLQGLTMLGLSYYTQDLIKGAVLLFALLMSFSLRRRVRKPAAEAAALDEADDGSSDATTGVNAKSKGDAR